MAEITRVNGSIQPQGQAGTITSDALVILEGTDKDFFKIISADVSGDANDLRGELDTGESIEKIFEAIMTRANIEFYQVEGDATGQISVAVYPSDAWTTTTLQAAVRALGTTVGGNSVDVSGSTVTTSGLEFV
jgi:hypothetical protein